ncbi:hypothetical protein SAMN05421788_104322 [Filimonas lacunae]|uniref:Uncharacterized protein n=1 Tax=Filimonas lacunae TaxID=477680 RepID=A0A173MS26_9BACT|nr:hypothetical protein [Filimonas lacunae]BAV10307.1 hypothetical protein FLA_6369 [Filimonas lacunae]SIT17249.1 hypothetical protein SAMN05421788_104322 [Filimonas lacunae]
MKNFSLWLEFQVFNPCNWHIENGFCNIHVDLPDGKYYGLQVGTYQYLDNAMHQHETPAQARTSRIPDLFVKELTRQCIEDAIRDLLSIGKLEDLLNPFRLDHLC